MKGVKKETLFKKEKCRLPAGFSNRGSASVEAAMALPVFLMAVCALFYIGQLLIVEGEIHYSLVQTARTCAFQEAKKLAAEAGSRKGAGKEGSGQSQDKTGPGLGLQPQSVFMTQYDGGALCDACIAGGSMAVLVTGKKDFARQEVRLTARYVLKIPVFLFRYITFPRKITIEERIFSGYLPHEGDMEERPGDRIVYVTERGTVYHLRADCSHICLTIKNAQAIKTVIQGGRFRPCEKCVKRKGDLKAIYITAEGDCYHSSLACSGLKRTVKAVYLSEIPGMRPCSRCGAGR